MAEKRELFNHVVVCGYGIVGQRIIDVLKENGIDFVVIEIDEAKVKDLKEKGYRAIQGDATFSSVLKDAYVTTAKAIAVVMDNDAKNLFTVLTARDLNKTIFIATRANDEFLKEKLTEAGADYVIMPQKSASKEILKELGAK